VIKIRPAKEPAQGVGDLLGNFKNTCDPTKLEREMDEATIKSMQEGDQLVVHTYNVKGAGVTLNMLKPGVQLGSGILGLDIGPVLEASLKSTNMDSAAFLMGKDRKLIAGWKERDDLTMQMGLRLRTGIPLLGKRPIFSIAGRSRGEEDKVYEFNLADAKEAKTLFDNLSVKLDKDLAKAAQPIQERDMDVKGRYRLLSLLGFVNSRKQSESARIEFTDNRAGASRTILSETRKNGYDEFFTLKSAHREYSASLIDEKGESASADTSVHDKLALKVKVDYESEFATINDFKNIEKPLGLFPAAATLWTKDKSAMGGDFGPTKLDGAITFYPSALEKIFSQPRSKKEICQVYAESIAQTLTQVVPHGLCEHIAGIGVSKAAGIRRVSHGTQVPTFVASYVRSADGREKLRKALLGAMNFVSDFEKAQLQFGSLVTKDGLKSDAKAQAALRSMVGILDNSEIPQASLRTLEALAGNRGVCAEFKLTAKNENLPNGNGTAIYTGAECRSLVKDNGVLDVAAASKIETDATYNVLDPLLFDYSKKIGHQKTSTVIGPKE
jgi:hypothetical protein